MADYSGTPAGDTYTGTPDPETISGEGGDDVLRGGDGDDVISGGPGADQVYGEGGNDRLELTDGDLAAGDLLDGGADTDEIHYIGLTDIDLSGVTITGVERLVASPGTTVGLTVAQLLGFSYVDATVRLTTTGYIPLDAITFAASDLYLADGGFNFVDLTNTPGTVAMTVHGGDQGNTILGSNSQNDTLYGGAYGNNLDGRGGNDILYGGAAADTLLGGGGTDAVYGYAGNDVLQIAEGDVAIGDRFDGGANTDRITYLGVIDFDLSVATIAGVETLYVDWGTTVSLTIAQLEGFSTVDAVARLTDGGAVDLSGTALAKGTLYLSDYGNTIDLSGAVSVPAGMSVYGGAAQDVITGTATTDTLNGGGGNDVLDGLAGDDVMIGGNGDDIYYVDSADDEVTEAANEGHDLVHSTAASYTLAANVEDLTYTGSSAFTGTGNSLGNAITGGDGNDTLIGRGGADDLRGGWGNDTFVIGEGDLLDGARFDGGVGLDTLRYVGSSNVDLSGATFIDIDELASDNDVLVSLTLAQLGSFDRIGPGFTVQLTDAGALTFTGLLLVSDLYLADAATVPGGTIGTTINLSGAFVSLPLSVHGSRFDDTIIGTNGTDDTLYGGGGTDSLSGGSGNDTLVVAEGDYVAGEIYDGGSMTDTLRYSGSSNIDLSGAAMTGIERLVSDNGVTVSLTVAQLESLTYVGPTVAVRLVDGGPVDLGGLTFEGSALYLSDDGNAVDLGDLVNASTAGFTVHGGAGQDQITGGANSDTLNGGGENDVLDGAAGADTMAGGAGDDTYYVDDAGDQVIEALDEGHDRVRTTLGSYTLVGTEIEDLTNIGASFLFFGTGNALDNVLTGSNGSMDVLTGGGGKDSLYGNASNDTLVVNEGDLVDGEIYDGGADNDTLQYNGTSDLDLSNVTLVDIEHLASNNFATFSLTIAQLESLDSTDARSGVRLIDGGAVNLNGLSLYGQALLLSDFGNTVDLSTLVNASGGAFTVLGGAGQDQITGTGGNDTLTGGGDDDVLDGGAGADSMTGGDGDDTYTVDNSGDVVMEVADEGHDHVRTTLNSYTLVGTEIEDLTNIGSSFLFFGTGNAYDNVLTGSDGSKDVLTGGAGKDSLHGNASDDTLIVNDGDLVDGEVYDGGAGDDTLQYAGTSDLDLSIVTLTGVEHLASNNFAVFSLTAAQLESLDSTDAKIAVRLTDGGAVDLSGLTLYSQTLLLSGLGNTVDLSTLVNASAGAFSVLGGAGQDQITGAGGNDTLTGGGDDDMLNGGAGADSMTGGDGDDTYYVDSAGDQVIENAGEGDHDKVVTSLNSYSIAGTEIEDLTYSGNDTFGGIGNGYANVITGGGGHDTLSGGGGADTLYGNAGDDIFIVNEGDSVVGATFDGGGDTDSLVYNGVSDLDLSGATLTGVESLESVYPATIYLTVAQLESLAYVDGNVTLKLVDGGPVDLSGVTIANRTLRLSYHGNSVDLTTAYTVPLTVYGGAGEDQITGTTGSDTLAGGAGKDSLSGAGGNDVLILAEGDYVAGETFDGGAGTDELRYTGTSAIDLSGATLTGLERLVGNNVNPNVLIDLTRAQLQSFGYVSAFVHLTDGGAISLGGMTMDVSAIYLSDLGNQIDLTGVLGTPYINVLGGRGNDTMIGNAAYNVLSGYNGNDVLDGKGGADYMAGGDGDDVVVVDDVNDDLREYSGNGHDRIETTLTSYALSDAFERHYEDLTYTGTGNFTGSGNALDNTITGGIGNDTLSGGTGKDSLIGAGGDDVLILAEGDSVAGETFDGGSGTDELRYTGTSNVDLTGATLVSIERLVSSSSPTALISLTIAQLESLSHVGGHVRIAEGGAVSLAGITMQFNTIDLSDDGNTIDASASGPFGLTINGGTGADTMLGTTGHADSLYGNGGNDWLDGQGGGDTMAGGAGDDTYVVDDSGDQIIESLNDGTDTVRTTLASYTLALGLENLTYTGTGNFIGAGNSHDNVITGGTGDDQLSGGSGTDSLKGGDGNDTLVLTGSALSIGDTFDGGSGTDELRYTGSANIDLSGITLTGIERLWVTQSVTVSLTIAQFETLTLVHPSAHIQIVDGGTVLVDGTNMPAVHITLSDYGNSIDLATVVTSNSATVHGGAAADEILGTDGYGDTLYGNGGNDVLDGKGGDDAMAGGAGDDTFHVDQAGDNVLEYDNEGHDRVETTLASYSLGSGVEDLVYTGAGPFAGTGNALDNAITGGSGNDLLKGLQGDDALDGAGGSDTASFTGNALDYTVVDNGDGTVTLTDTRPGSPDGADTLTSIEFIAFADGTLAMAALLNEAPVAVDDALAATEDVAVTYSAAQIVGNDTDGDLDTLTITAVSNATGGVALLNPDGTITFTPAAEFSGTAGFDYTVSDGGFRGTDSGHVTITVAAVDDPAAITGDSAGDVTEAGGTANGTPGAVSASGDLDATDVDNSADAWQAVAAGTASVGGYGTYAVTAAGAWSYTLDDSDPAVQALNAAGTLLDTFVVLTEGGTAQTVTITIHGQDDSAAATNDAFATDEATAIAGGNLFADNGNGVDNDPDDPLSIAAVNGLAGNVGGQITLASGALLTVHADGTFDYDPNGKFDHLVSPATAGTTNAADAAATDSFTYTLAGGGTATVTVTVTGVDGAGDQLWGDAAANTIADTGGVDYFDLSQGGDDTANGLGGDDSFYFGSEFTAGDTVDGGAGTNDQIGLEGDYSGANALVLGPTTISNVEVIALLPGFDYDLTTVDANVTAGGTLKVFAGNLGADDDFTFDGSAETNGKFMVYAGAGTDHVTTGAGNDGIYFGPGKFDPLVDRVDGGTGTNDQLALDGHYTLTLDGTAIQNIDVIALLRGAAGDLATYDLTVANSLVGAGQTMTLWGTPVETAMTIDGSGELDGALRIYGGSAGDTITGSNGDDWVWGGLGADALSGGGGADTFMYDRVGESRADLSPGGGYDTIIGFDDAADKIDLAGFTVTGFAGPLSGALDAVTMDSMLEIAFTGLAAHQAAVFTATGGDLAGTTFLLIDANGTTGYQASGDFLIAFAAPVSPIDNLGMFI